MIAGAQAQDGARAYFAVPAGSNNISGTATYVHTEVSGSMFDAAVFSPSFQHQFDLGGDSASFLIGVPFGGVSGTIPTLGGPLKLSNNPALGDAFVGATVGLVNAPSLSPMQYAQYQPGFTASVAGRVFLPTGDYDSSRILNLGANRWSFEAMLPMSFIMGSSVLDPNLTTFDIVPNVQFFGDNSKPSLANLKSQAPLFGLEGHVTHNFNPAIWGSLDASAKIGGETTNAAGVAQGDGQRTLALGATLGATLSQSFALRFSYQEQVYSNVPKAVNRTLMGTAAFLF